MENKRPPVEVRVNGIAKKLTPTAEYDTRPHGESSQHSNDVIYKSNNVTKDTNAPQTSQVYFL